MDGVDGVDEVDTTEGMEKEIRTAEKRGKG